MIQKVLKVGSSAAVTIPKKSLDELNLKIGDSVIVSISGQEMNVRPYTKEGAIVGADTVAWAKNFIETYRPALEALKDK